MKFRFIILMFFLYNPSYAAKNCFYLAGKDYGIDPLLLVSIAHVESNLNPHAINYKNKNDSIDVGLMQINSFHFKRIGITKTQLLKDPCLNIYVGAFILAELFYVNGYNWDSVGAYNAGLKKSREKARKKYFKKVQHIYQILKKQHY